MSASIKSSPSPPVLPKPEGRRIKSSHSLVSPVEDHDRALLELPELKEKQVPVTDRSKMQLVPMQNDLIPDELLATLTSTICPHDRLGPPKLTKTPKDFKVYGIRHTDAVWHHPVGRKKYKYFLDQPTSLTGAGRDISFLCDSMASQRERIPLPPMADRGTTHTQGIQKDMSLMESLIPEEYHIVKNKGVQGLECYDDKFTVLLEDDERMLKVFPSMRPSGRLEAVQLMKVMDEMLDRAGVNQEYRALTGLSQMQGLLELVRVEQNIYNIVFHELIRQVSVECAERGQLLAKLRQRYVALLDRIPRQLKGLHTETLAQRALDRRLTEEIICFRSSISKLNTELCKMREHDEYVSKQAERAQEELAKALEQSQKNSDVVGEYHGLYEMQRRRLEGQVARLTDERDLWSRVTYNLALKVIKLNNLQLASRLHVSEQTWTKTAEHFTLFLTSKDTEDLNHIMQLTEQWKEQLTSFVQSLREAEHGHCEGISSIQADIVKWHTFVGTNIRSPDPKFEKVSEEQLYSDLKQWSNALTIQCERYGGEDLLSCQETLKMLGQLQEAWEEVGLRLFRRHPAPDGEPPRGQEAMRELGLAVSELHKQLGTRINGESGIHKQLMSLVGVMEFWATRLKALVGRTERLPHCDWLKLEKALGSWMLLAEESLKHVHSTQPENERVKHKPHVQIEINDVFNTLREFILTQANFFDCENRRLCEEVNSIHTALTRWMVDMLLQMVPDHCDDQEQDALPGINTTAIMEVSLEQLEEDAKNLSEKLDYFSKYITSSCRAIVEEEIQRSMARDDSENELSELSKLQRECGEWMESCRILLSDKKGSPVELLVTLNLVHRSFTELLPSAMPSMESLMNLPAVVPLEALDEEEEPNKKSPMEFIEVVHMVEAEYPEEALECSLAGSIMKLIGHDGNIIERTLGEDTIQLDGTEDMVARPHTPNGQRAFDALATVGVLQHELLGVEARVQRAEERALKAEEALQAALEKIQDLERQLQGRPSLEAKVSKQSVAASPKSKVSSPEPKPVSQKPEPSPRQTKPKKR
ncbi:axonemal dynein light chain domain-containing protein 1 [Oncorhynchus mykiss]|uniref:Axonemal dynein light chain domain containing 1 n=1 Tax=Oncorhynchus mykiss TaxID=8022 RepID=A0A8C7V8U8_ONCMY|nr:axonemal dynein light chain domain-containing protein 1 [Oncorhynchus mykiss]